MKYFTVLTSDGKVSRTGQCTEEAFETQANAEVGETVVEGMAPFSSSEPTFSWRGHRMREYPPLQQLADALYWSQRGDQSLMEAYLAACDEVKRKYPKP